MNKIFKVFFAFCGTILIGAIGSGVWEKLLSPLLNYLLGGLTYFLSSMSKSYEDSIYATASTISYEGQSVVIVVFGVMILSLFCIFSATKSLPNSFLAKAINSVLSTYVKGWSGVVVGVSLLIFSIFLLSNQSSVFKIRKYSIKSMHIVRPYIGEESYYKLYSDYLLMKNKDDFDAFLYKIEWFDKAHDIGIEPFSLK
ncbi:hypothetical protein D5E78_30500 [Vibrio parahaemolyticus]|nr:hypothetical protein D5E78_30500 [Vibrio parahaemolyticus]